MTENSFPNDPNLPADGGEGTGDQSFAEQDTDEEDQDAGPTTMAPPGEGIDAQGQVG